jgi:hypothetical protein
MFTVRWISIGAFPLCLPVARTWIALQAFVSFLLTFRTHSCAEEGVDQRWLSNSALCSIEKFGVERTPQIFSWSIFDRAAAADGRDVSWF